MNFSSLHVLWLSVFPDFWPSYPILAHRPSEFPQLAQLLPPRVIASSGSSHLGSRWWERERSEPSLTGHLQRARDYALPHTCTVSFKPSASGRENQGSKWPVAMATELPSQNLNPGVPDPKHAPFTLLSFSSSGTNPKSESELHRTEI